MRLIVITNLQIKNVGTNAAQNLKEDFNFAVVSDIFCISDTRIKPIGRRIVLDKKDYRKEKAQFLEDVIIHMTSAVPITIAARLLGLDETNAESVLAYIFMVLIGLADDIWMYCSKGTIHSKTMITIVRVLLWLLLIFAWIGVERVFGI